MYCNNPSSECVDYVQQSVPDQRAEVTQLDEEGIRQTMLEF